MNGWGMNGWIYAKSMDGIHESMYAGCMYGYMAGANIFKGTCKWYDTRRGFGFIVPDNKSMFGDVFVHHTTIHARGFRSLNAWEQVEFTVIQKNYRWYATRVTGPNGAYVEGPSESARTKG